MRATHIQRLGDILGGYRLRDVFLNIASHVEHEFRVLIAHVQFCRSFGVVERHMKLKVDNSVLGGEQLAFSDIRVAQGEGVASVHTAGDCRSGYERGSHYKSVFKLSKLVGCQNSRTDGRRFCRPGFKASTLPFRTKFMIVCSVDRLL